MQMQRIDDAIGIAGTVGHSLPQAPHHLPATETGHHGTGLPETRRGGGRPVPAAPVPRRRLGWLLRRLVALSLVVLVLWWLAVPLFFPITTQAVVNARLVQVRAPIDGTAADRRSPQAALLLSRAGSPARNGKPVLSLGRVPL